MWILALALIGCGESVAFEPEEFIVEDVEPEPEPVAEDPIERAPELQAPTDGRPEEFVEAAKTPQPGQPWPPITVPEDQLEREWNWDFKTKGTTRIRKEKQQVRALKEPSLKDLEKIEAESEAAGFGAPDN